MPMVEFLRISKISQPYTTRELSGPLPIRRTNKFVSIQRMLLRCTESSKVFHTDAGDVISLFALEVAAEGGVSKISSSWKVYNHLAEHRPDLIETLSQPWPYDGCVVSLQLSSISHAHSLFS